MRFGSIAHAQQFTKETRLIVTSSKNSGQIQAPCHLTLSMINLMTNEADGLAGDRSEGNFSVKLAAQIFVVLLRTPWKQILLAMMITPWVSNCWSGIDLAQL